MPGENDQVEALKKNSRIKHVVREKRIFYTPKKQQEDSKAHAEVEDIATTDESPRERRDRDVYAPAEIRRHSCVCFKQVQYCLPYLHLFSPHMLCCLSHILCCFSLTH